MNLVSKEDINEKVQSLGNLITDGASMVKLYPVLKQATSSSPHPTPGYLYQILIEFSLKGKKNCDMLGDYLTRRLCRPSPHAKLKTLKCIHHLIDKGSANIRQYLRSNDEEVRSLSSGHSSEKDNMLGEIKLLAKTILKELFNEKLVQSDERAGEEVSELKLTGMGSQNKNSQGFGNTVNERPGLTATLRDVMEQIVYAPDPKQELLESCLKSSVGDYQAASVDLSSSPSFQKYPPKSRVQELTTCTHTNSNDYFGTGASDGDLENDTSAAIDSCHVLMKESQEFSNICSFCKQEDTNIDFDNLQELVISLGTGNKPNIIQSIQYILNTENGNSLLRTLILLEKIIEKSVLPPPIINQAFRTSLELKRLDSNKSIAIKSSKILATLEFIKNYKQKN